MKEHTMCARARIFGVVVAVAFSGCASSQDRHYDRMWAQLREAAPPDGATRSPHWGSHLDREAYVTAVLERNPSIEAARQGWRAAVAHTPQATAVDDPRLEYAFAPLSIGAEDVSYGQVVTLTQRLPWPGKRGLRGEVALAEAEAAKDDYDATRLRLALMASILFDNYYAVGRALALNTEHAQLMKDIKAATLAQYQAGRVSQQEPLSAELELAHVAHQRVVLKSRRAMLVAQMNSLLHRPPQASLPPPPEKLALPMQAVPDTETLQARALANRPLLHASHSLSRSRAFAVDLADRDYYPDVGLMAQYNSMWRETEHQWMLGISFAIPIQLGAKDAAVEQAEARLSQSRSQIAALEDRIRAEVETARQKLIEAQHVIHLYRERLIPTVRAQIEAAQVAYATGRGSFQALIDAERSLRSIQLSYEEAVATLARRQAELSRATGQIPGLPEGQVKP
ncbi:MAG TPA: TolC family protein [Kofleriaceae bacterium]|nr:TolC family protein [Kofleriaceae bacterium]